MTVHRPRMSCSAILGLFPFGLFDNWLLDLFDVILTARLDFLVYFGYVYWKIVNVPAAMSGLD